MSNIISRRSQLCSLRTDRPRTPHCRCRARTRKGGHCRSQNLVPQNTSLRHKVRFNSHVLVWIKLITVRIFTRKNTLINIQCIGVSQCDSLHIKCFPSHLANKISSMIKSNTTPETSRRCSCSGSCTDPQSSANLPWEILVSNSSRVKSSSGSSSLSQVLSSR